MAHEHVDRPTKRHILSHGGVVSVSESVDNGQRVLVIGVEPGCGLSGGDFPQTVQGLPVRVTERDRLNPGAVTARAGESNRSVVRPVEAGLSVELPLALGVGSSGFALTDGERLYITSNYHVFNTDQHTATPGDAIVQPSISDDSLEQGKRVVAHYTGGVAPVAGEANTVDVAWAELAEGISAVPEVHDVGPVTGTYQADVGAALVKSGRTTGVTTGEAKEVAAMVLTSDGQVFENQIIATNMSDPGDSGSPVLLDDGSGRAVGMLWGGSESETAIMPIDEVLVASGMELLTDESADTGPGEAGGDFPWLMVGLLAAVFVALSR